MAHEVAYVLKRNIEDSSLLSIWDSVEFPVLQQSTNPEAMVNWIAAIQSVDNSRVGDIVVTWIRDVSDSLIHPIIKEMDSKIEGFQEFQKSLHTRGNEYGQRDNYGSESPQYCAYDLESELSDYQKSYNRPHPLW